MNAPNDFTRPLADLIASLEDRVRLGVEQPRSVVAIFKGSIGSYELPSDSIGVSRVAGWRQQVYGAFAEGVDYAFAAARLQWLGPPADEGSRLDIETVWREPPSGLTDFNPGSVAGTLLRAVARELALMYAQMDQAYRRAFIDEATGAALDNVVALLGVRRVPAQPATGRVTFLRRKAALQAVTIGLGTRVADKAGRVFATVAEATILVAAEELTTPAGNRVATTDKIAALIGVWGAADPPGTAPLAVLPGFGDDERSVTLAAAPPGSALRIRYNPKSVTVGVRAQVAGPDGNENAQSLIVMPTPPKDVDAVVNEDPIGGGEAAESDERLRERAKHALERAGNATLNAIHYAVLQVEGVEGVEVVDHQGDDAIPLGQVRVRYAGADSDALRTAVVAAVEATRAAGVMAVVEQIVRVTLSGVFYLVPSTAPQPAAGGQFLAATVAAIDALTIGQPLAIGRLRSIAYTLPGLADLAEAQLVAHQPQPSSPGVPVVSDPLIARSTELIRADATALRAVQLAAVVLGDHTLTAAGQYRIGVRLRDSAGNLPSFHALALDVFVSVRAQLKSNPTEAPLRIAGFTKSVRFTDASTAALDLNVAADVPNFDPTVHVHAVQFVVNAAAYPGLASGSATFDITV